MKKLNLDLASLRVDRFDVMPESAGDDGTVMANQIPLTFQSCGPNTCYPQESCVTGSPCRKCAG
jgi:hypothetical protein